MAFKMKGPSLLKMVAELKKSPTKSFKPETMKKTSGGKSGSLSDVVTNVKGKAIKALDKIEKKAIKGIEKPVEQARQRASKTSTLIPGIAQAVGVSFGPLSVGAAANIAKNLLKNTKSTKTKAFGKKASPTKQDVNFPAKKDLQTGKTKFYREYLKDADAYEAKYSKKEIAKHIAGQQRLEKQIKRKKAGEQFKK